ncbi:hypothetical protein P9112_002915 [Eukaryota sp. TZLM1-RC]
MKPSLSQLEEATHLLSAVLDTTERRRYLNPIDIDLSDSSDDEDLSHVPQSPIFRRKPTTTNNDYLNPTTSVTSVLSRSTINSPSFGSPAPSRLSLQDFEDQMQRKSHTINDVTAAIRSRLRSFRIDSAEKSKQLLESEAEQIVHKFRQNQAETAKQIAHQQTLKKAAVSTWTPVVEEFSKKRNLIETPLGQQCRKKGEVWLNHNRNEGGIVLARYLFKQYWKNHGPRLLDQLIYLESSKCLFCLRSLCLLFDLKSYLKKEIGELPPGVCCVVDGDDLIELSPYERSTVVLDWFKKILLEVIEYNSELINDAVEERRRELDTEISLFELHDDYSFNLMEFLESTRVAASTKMEQFDLMMRDYEELQAISSKKEHDLMFEEDKRRVKYYQSQEESQRNELASMKSAALHARNYLIAQHEAQARELRLMKEEERNRCRVVRKRKLKLRQLQLARLQELSALKEAKENKERNRERSSSVVSTISSDEEQVSKPLSQEKQAIAEKFKARAQTMAIKKSIQQEEEKKKKDYESKLRNQVLLEGATLTKYSSRGNPSSRFFWFDEDFYSLNWRSTKAKNDSSSNSIVFSDISALKRGCDSEVFSMQDSSRLRPNCCFTLVASDRSLDLEAQDPIQAEDWCTAIQSLISQRTLSRNRQRSATVTQGSIGRIGSLRHSQSVSSLH